MWGDIEGTDAHESARIAARDTEKEQPVLQLLKYTTFVEDDGKLTRAAMSSFILANRPTFEFAGPLNDGKTLHYANRGQQLDVILQWIREGEFDLVAEATENDPRDIRDVARGPNCGAVAPPAMPMLI